MKEFNLQIKLLKTIGFSRSPSKLVQIASKTYITWNYFVIAYFILSSIYYAYNSNDIVDISESLAPTFSGIYTSAKYIMFCMYGNQFYEILDELKALNEKWSKNKKHEDIILKANKFSVKFSLAVTYGCITAGTFYNLKPLGTDIINYLVYGSNPSHILPFKSKYLYNVQTFPGYHLTYFIDMSYTYFVVMTTGAIGAVFSFYCLNIAAHFEILRDIVNDTELRKFLDYHRQMIRLTKKISKLFKPIIFTEFFIVATILCLTGLQVLVVDDLGNITAAFLHALASTIDVAIFSYGGQKVLDSALAVCKEVYKMDKNYIFIILITQKELKFDTGLFDASLDTLSIMLSRSISFITLLKSCVKPRY